MRKRDKLYTVNKWNKNLFVTGGPEGTSNEFEFPLYGANQPELGYAAARPVTTTISDPFMSEYASSNPTITGGIQGLDISKANDIYGNPINSKSSWLSSIGSSINGNAALSAGVSAAAPIVGNLTYSGISGGLNSGVGSAVNGIGSAVGGAVGKVNPALGAAVTLGSAIVGGGINAAFGTGVDEKKKARNEAGIAAYNNFNSNAGGFDQLQDATSQAKVRNAYRSGFLNRGWANKRNRDALNRWVDARNFALSSIENNAENLAREQTDWALANYAAYGGELNTENMDNNYMDNMFSAGGSIHIKHPGRLTALKKRTGKTEAELWAEGNPDVRKMITFARSARKWHKHGYGGYLQGRVYDVPEEEVQRLINSGYEIEYL